MYRPDTTQPGVHSQPRLVSDFPFNAVALRACAASRVHFSFQKPCNTWSGALLLSLSNRFLLNRAQRAPERAS